MNNKGNIPEAWLNRYTQRLLDAVKRMPEGPQRTARMAEVVAILDMVEAYIKSRTRA